MDILIQQGNLVLKNVLSIKSVNADMFHALGGLTGALAVMLEFVEKRIKEDNPLDEVMAAQIRGTLANIGAKLDDFHKMYSREVCGIPYAKLWVVAAPLVGMGSKRILTQLRRLEADLSGDIALLDLQIQSNQAMALYEIAGGHFLKKFTDADLKNFWTSNFENDQRVPAREFADALAAETGLPAKACAYAATSVASAGGVDALAFNRAAAGLSLEEWASSVDGLVTTLVNASAGEVTCMTHHRGHLVTGSADKVAKVFHIRPDATPLLKTVLVGHTGPINDISCEGGLVATASDDATVKVWNIMDGTLLKTVEHDAPVNAVFFSGPGTLVTATNSSTQNVAVHDLETDRVSAKLYGHVGGTAGISVLGSKVFTAGTDRAIKSWDVETGVQTQEVRHAHAHAIECVTADRLLATYADTVLKVWTMNREGGIVELCSLNVGLKSYADVHGMQIRDGRLYVAISDFVMSGRHSNSRIVVVDVRSKKVLHTIRVDGESPSVHPTSICVIGDAVYAGLSDGGIRWYRDLEEVGASSIPKHAGAVLRSSLAPGRPLLAAASGSFVAGKTGSPDLLVNGVRTATLPVPATSVHATPTKFYAGAENAVFSIARDGAVEKMCDVGGTVGSLFVRGGALYAQVFTPETRYAKYRKNKVVKVAHDGAVETIAQDVYSLDANICDFGGELVYPGVNDGELGVYDMEEGAALPPVKYSMPTVTHIRSAGDELWTVHGGMDIAVWKYLPDGYLSHVRTITTDAEVADLAVSETAITIAYTDGTVEKRARDGGRGKTLANHKSGPVALAGPLALGVEMRLSFT